MFRRISYKIALQFTAFVFLLFLVNGALFLAADVLSTHRQMRFRLERMAQTVAVRFELEGMPFKVMGMPPNLREQVRVLDAEGKTLFAGTFFEDVPVDAHHPWAEVTVGDRAYVILTDPFLRDGRRAGFVQIADVLQYPRKDWGGRITLYLLVSVAVSALTFLVGLFFARRSLKPAEQMVERLEQFTQDASHELRTPLAALRSSLDLALHNGKYREGIVSAKEDVKEVTVLVDRLLELARLDRFVLRPAPVDLSALVSDAVKKFRPLAKEKGIALEGDVTPGVSVTGDVPLLRQVLGNLLSNAIKFNKEKGGSVTVRLTKHAFTVQDTGVGIAKKELPHIFNRFYQANSSRAGEGYGLGLALAKRIVELHGWKIGVKSKVHEGTEFVVEFGK
ncbi:MAG: HAMP domain-containing sensor histidine kinase [Candidatus Peribacteraceae bacterium]|jgi:signal transduction histidine kinase